MRAARAVLIVFKTRPNERLGEFRPVSVERLPGLDSPTPILLWSMARPSGRASSASATSSTRFGDMLGVFLPWRRAERAPKTEPRSSSWCCVHDRGSRRLSPCSAPVSPWRAPASRGSNGYERFLTGQQGGVTNSAALRGFSLRIGSLSEIAAGGFEPPTCGL